MAVEADSRIRFVPDMTIEPHVDQTRGAFSRPPNQAGINRQGSIIIV